MNANEMTFQIELSVPLYPSGTESIHVTACEGGINYWAELQTYDFRGTSTVTDMEDENASYDITAEVIAKGVQRIVSGEVKISPSIRLSIIREVMEAASGGESDGGCGCDANEADCIVQAGLFGEIVYG
jgi:hypothetical protein